MGYEPIFKLSYSNIVLTDLFLPPYGHGFDTTVVIDGGRWEFFLSHESLERAAEIGFGHAFDKNKVANFEERHAALKAETDGLKRIDLSGMSNEEFVSFLGDFRRLCHGAFGDYKETEFFYFKRIEDELSRYIEGRFSIDDVLSNRVDLSGWPEDKRRLAEYVIRMQHLKFEFRKSINDIVIGDDSILSEVLEQLRSRTGRKDALSMTFEEAGRVLGGQELDDVSDRHELSVIRFDAAKDRLVISVGDEAREMRKALKKDLPDREVRGMTARGGVARGKVKIILTSLTPEIGAVEEGCILVSDTTGPEMVAVMRKVAAIVTDEGGLMSHAAVVAREFGVPCVVGTKYATEVFKDGDVVEVNADTGVVRKV